MKSLSRVRLFATPWMVAHQASPSMGFSRQEYWSGLPFAGYIMRNAKLGEAQAGSKIARRSINNFIYADDTILMAESKEELKSLLMKVIEESKKARLKLKKLIHGIWSYHFTANRWGHNGNSDRILLSCTPKSLWTMNAAIKLNDVCSLEEKQ